ncbi:hypothetical protein [Fodinicola feengrottensis]|uniref:hypothetical protein n=1 Tax=Fodinicola feengrottensis TaxID=435914 RepID=UPI002442FA38|nr:hypothetical protein [Fodinicola feengrottensis]
MPYSAGLAAVILGAMTMFARKAPGRHPPPRGRRYLVALGAVFVTGTAIATTNWAHLWHLATTGLVAVACATTGYLAHRIQWRGWLWTHIPAMTGSYTAMLTAFYVDNGPRRLPVWNLLPAVTFWFLPTAVAVPLLVRALRKYAGKTGTILDSREQIP